MNKQAVQELKSNIREQLSELKKVVSSSTYHSYNKKFNDLAQKTTIIRNPNHGLLKLQDNLRYHKESGIATKSKLREVKKREREISQEEKNKLLEWKKNPHHIVVYVWLNIFVKVDKDDPKFNPNYEYYKVGNFLYQPVSGKAKGQRASFYISRIFNTSKEAYECNKKIPRNMDLPLAESLFKFFDFSGDFLGNLAQANQSNECIAVVAEKGVREQKDYDNTNDEMIDAVYFPSEEAFDDTACSIICPRQFLKFDVENIGAKDIQYKSKYVLENYLPRSCWASLILDLYKTSIEGHKNKKGKKLLTYETLHKIMKPDSEFNREGNNGYSFNDVKNFFSLERLGLYLFDINLNLKCYYEPINRNKNINPNCMYVILHDKHIYHMNDDMNSLQQKMSSYIEKSVNNELCSFPSSKYFIKEKEVEFVDYDIIENADDVIEIVQNKVGYINLYYNGGDCFDLYYGLMDKGVKCNIMMKNNQVCLEKLHINSFKDRDVWITTLQEEGVTKSDDFDNSEQLIHYTKLKNTVINNLISKTYLSSYSDNVLKMFNMSKKPPLNGSFKVNTKDIIIDTFTGLDPKYSQKVMNGNANNRVINPEWIKEFDVRGNIPHEIIELDFNKFYTSILQDMDMIPLVNSFDEFIDYNGEPIDDLNVYYVEKTIENDEYPFYQFNICYGKNIKGVENINIISVLNTSKNKKCNFKEFVKTVYEDTSITAKMKKDIFNHIVGNWNKSLNKKTYTDLKMDMKEAVVIKKTNGGRIIPLERDDKMYYLNYMEKSMELQEGFRLISTLIYDTAHKRLLDLKKKVEDYGFTVFFCNTDCLWVNKNMKLFEKFKNDNIDLFTYTDKDNYDAIGKLKWKVKLYEQKGTIVRVNVENVYDIIRDEVPVNHIQLKDEFDRDEIMGYIQNTDRLLSQGVAGGGKSNVYKNLDENVLFITPYNALCRDIRKSGKNAITLVKLLGIKIEEHMRGKEFDITDYDRIVFDEIFLYDTVNLLRIKKYIDRHTEMKFNATGDCNQLLPIDPELKVKNVRKYYQNIIYSIFPNVINLTQNKRCVKTEDRLIMDNLNREILNCDTKKELLDILKKYNITIIDNYDEVTTKKNICNTNSSCDSVNNLIMKKYHTSKYNVGDELICRKSLILKKQSIKSLLSKEQKSMKSLINILTGKKQQRTFVNYTYTIMEIKENSMILNDDEEDIEVDIDLIKKYFKLPYARTCCSVQGMTIDEKITIFDFWNNHVDKHWIYTAITRTTELSNVCIHLKYNNQKEMLIEKIRTRIEGHKQADIRADRLDNWNEYIDIQYAYDMLIKTKVCKYCLEPIDSEGDNCFSIDRIDNNLAHIKSNCQIICVNCNVTKK